MGEPVSIAASIAGLITISAQVVGMAKEVFNKMKDAPETMMRVREEVESHISSSATLAQWLRPGAESWELDNDIRSQPYGHLNWVYDCLFQVGEEGERGVWVQ